MSFGATKLLSASGGKAYEIDQSLMFNSADTAYLNRTPSSAGNRRTFTLSAWIKTTDGFAGDPIFCCSTGTNDASTTYIAFYQGKMYYQGYSTNYRVTNRLFRDVGAWYHFVWAVDTTIADGSADNRIRLYVNGVEETSFGTKNNPAQNYEFIINSTNEHQLGDEGGQTGGYPPFDGYMAEVNFIDGSQLTPSSFGKTDSETGQWIPKKYGGAYGTNGFYLKFVSGAIGTDSSGEGNNYTANNLANADVLLDTPTNNFPTLNSLMGNAASGLTLSQGNLKAAQSSLTSETAKAYSTMAFVSGKWYAEVSCSAANVYSGHGVVNVSQSSEGFDFDSSTLNFSAFTWGDRIFKNGSQTQDSLNSTASGSNIIGIALDLDNGTVQFYSNGSTSGSAETLTRNDGDLFVFCDAADSGGYASNSAYEWNFGQNGTHSGTKTAGGNTDGNGIGNFVNSVPSGFLAPSTSNLAIPTIKKPTEHFNTVLYTGDGNDNRGVSGLGFSPALVWIKNRSNAYSHMIYDRLRGAGNYISSDVTNAEASGTHMNSFDSDGFSVTRGSSSRTNESGQTYVAWNWKANGSGSANNSGDINATVSPNPTAGFSIVSWTGDGSNDSTVAHGLGKKPKAIFMRDRSATALIYVATDVIDGSQDYLALGSTTYAAAANYGTTTTSTISNWTYGASSIIAYCFAEVEGFSKIGSYEANGNVNGPFIHTGFTPAWIMFKYVDGAGESWWMLDSTRDTINPTTETLYANLTAAESSIGSSGSVDFLSNGFKIRATNGGINSANTYFYMAFAEFPFKYANAR